MPTTIDILRVRRILGRDEWLPPEPFGPDGWRLISRAGDCSAVVSAAPMDDGAVWIHASMTRPGRVPTYAEMCQLHRAVWGDAGYSYEVHPPRSQHVNIHEHALHLWGRADGRPVLPEFGMAGSI